MASPASPILTLYNIPETTIPTYGLQLLEMDKQKIGGVGQETLQFSCGIPCDHIAVDDGSDPATYTYFKVDPVLFQFDMGIVADAQPLPPITIKGSGAIESDGTGSQTDPSAPVVVRLTFDPNDSSLTPATAAPPYTKAYIIASDIEAFMSCTIYPQGKGNGESFTVPLSSGFKILLLWMGGA